MKTVITITENKARRGSFSVGVKRPGKNNYIHDVYGIGEASAKAVELANGCDGEYHILGDKRVQAEILTGGIKGNSSN